MVSSIQRFAAVYGAQAAQVQNRPRFGADTGSEPGIKQTQLDRSMTEFLVEISKVPDSQELPGGGEGPNVVTLGREHDNTIVMPSRLTKISRHHLRFEKVNTPEGPKVTVQDVGTMNGSAYFTMKPTDLFPSKTTILNGEQYTVDPSNPQPWEPARAKGLRYKPGTPVELQNGGILYFVGQTIQINGVGSPTPALLPPGASPSFTRQIAQDQIQALTERLSEDIYANPRELRNLPAREVEQRTAFYALLRNPQFMSTVEDKLENYYGYTKVDARQVTLSIFELAAQAHQELNRQQYSAGKGQTHVAASFEPMRPDQSEDINRLLSEGFTEYKVRRQTQVGGLPGRAQTQVPKPLSIDRSMIASPSMLEALDLIAPQVSVNPPSALPELSPGDQLKEVNRILKAKAEARQAGADVDLKFWYPANVRFEVAAAELNRRYEAVQALSDEGDKESALRQLAKENAPIFDLAEATAAFLPLSYLEQKITPVMADIKKLLPKEQ